MYECHLRFKVSSQGFPGADPGFGQGGKGQLPRLNIANVAKWSHAGRASP